MATEVFREHNRFLVYLVNFSGLYMTSIESLTRRKWLLTFLAVWTKIAVVLLPVYIGSVIKFLAFDEAPFAVKMPVFRRMIAFSSFLFKNIFFYVYRREIEGLVDLWDSFFKEELYPKSRQEKLRIDQRRNVKILSGSWVITLLASLIYTVPPFFYKSKTLSHPSGIPYRRQSPDFELMVIFDFFRVVMGCISAVSLDCILMVFLSHVLVQLTHLRDTLSHIVDAISIDADGRIIYKTEQSQPEKAQLYVNELAAPRGNDTSENPTSEELFRRYTDRVEQLDREMTIWILHNQQLIRFFEGIKNLFSPVASVQLVYVVFYTCFTAFHLVRAKIGIDAFVIPFVAASNLISLFVWCYLGHKIQETSSEMFGEAFDRCWFLLPRRIQRGLSFVVMRGWKPLILRGISLFDLNLFTFFQVFKITYQLFAFLLQVAREE